ncbi:MAG: hypothetical protein HC848_03890 [Limnobacter sp.]|nr:hypothetical protein [Limnobacter sp.]
MKKNDCKEAAITVYLWVNAHNPFLYNLLDYLAKSRQGIPVFVGWIHDVVQLGLLKAFAVCGRDSRHFDQDQCSACALLFVPFRVNSFQKEAGPCSVAETF